MPILSTSVIVPEGLDSDSVNRHPSIRRNNHIVFIICATVFTVCAVTILGRRYANEIRLPRLNISDPDRDELINSAIVEFVSKFNTSALVDEQSPQFLARKWIIYDDKRRIPADHSHLLQRYTMAVLYYSLDGDNWETNNDTGDENIPSFWLSMLHECDWLDLDYERGDSYSFCDDRGRVSYLQLSGRAGSGIIPPEISVLTELRALVLRQNNIHGMIPSVLGDLSALNILLLLGNNLSGTIPVELSNLKYLTWFDLSENKLTGSVPEEFGQSFPFIVWFSVSGNSLSGEIPQDFCSYEELQILGADCYGAVTCSCCTFCEYDIGDDH